MKTRARLWRKITRKRITERLRKNCIDAKKFWNCKKKIQVLRFFRENNCRVSEENDDKLKAVIIEFGNEFGIDAFAVYSDLEVTWYSGADNTLLEFIISKDAHPVYDQFWYAADRGSQQAISHPTEIPPLPPSGCILISFLSKDGIAFGMGAREALIN